MVIAARASLITLICGVIGGGEAAGQVASDTIRVPLAVQRPAIATVDTTLRPPISPRRALILGMLAPGYPQTLLDRPKTAALFMSVEALAIAFARKSAVDLRDARRHAADSVIATFRLDPATGQVVLDDEGRPIVATYLPNEFGVLVAARRTHLEDWLAILIFNHLISGAEGFVSATLWDLPARVSGERVGGQSFLRVSIPW